MVSGKHTIELKLYQWSKMNIDDIYKSFGMEQPEGQGDPSLYSKEEKLKKRIHQSLGWDASDRRRTWWRYSMAVAAMLSLIVFVGGYWFLNKGSAGGQLLTFSSPAGSAAKVILPDGSQVWLNAASILKYPAQFGKNRDVYLEEGEGFFEVKRDTMAPFVVHSRHLNTRVLGTSFRVKAYQSLAHEVVTVISGKVSVFEGAVPLGILEKDQEIKFAKNTRSPLEQSVVANETVDWTTGQIILKSVRFEDIMLAIENAYQVEIRYDKKKFEGCESSIRFGTNQRLEDVLDLVRDIQGITYSISGKEVIITGTGCL